MVRECLDQSPVIRVGESFVTKWGNVRLISIYSSTSGLIGIKPNSKSEIIISTIDNKVEDVTYMTVKTNFFTIMDGGCSFWVCGPDVPVVTPTPAPTPVPEDTVNISIATDSHGSVELYSVLYWQSGMSGWANIPDKIPDKPTQFAVYWKSTAVGTVCGFVNMEINAIGVSPVEGNGQCVTSIGTAKVVRFGVDKLPADARLRINACDTKDCPPGTIVCRKACIPGTYTKVTGRVIDGECEQIPNSPDCGYVGFIKCQAYDSVSNAGLSTTVQVDGLTIVPKTPCTTQELSPGDHTVTFILDGYATKTVTVTVKAGETVNAYGSMVKEALPDVPGFDIKLNIPGLLPQSTLRIEQVVKVPLTDTWWDSPIGHAIRWDNVSNGVYKARGRSADSSPTPSYHVGFDENEDYAVYVGTSAVSLYPKSVVHRSTGTVTEIDLTSSYIDWISSKVCAALDITPANCPFFIASSVNDAAFFLELWSIITKHENLAGEHTLPTALDYALLPIAIFGMLSPGLSEGKIVQIVGRRITELIPIAKKGTEEVSAVLSDPRIDSFMLRATPTQFTDFVRYCKDGLHINAKNLLKQVDDAPLSENDIHALQRASKFVESLDPKLIKAGSIESIKTVLKGFSTKFKNIFLHALDFARDNPKTAIGIGVLTIWFMVDNVPFYIYMYLKSKGRSPGDRSWQAKLYVDKIDQYKFNVINAEKIQDWDLFCSNLGLMEDAVDTLETYILANKSVLENEETYDVYEGTVQVYREAIKLKREVHTCVVTIPESIDAEVIEILDSDTVKIRYNSSEYTVRLLGINAPEGKFYDYTCTGIRSPFLVRKLLYPGKECIQEETWNVDEALYNSTKLWLSQNLPVHQMATFYSDSARQFDKYGRLLASPYYNGKFVCRESLKAGMSAIFFYDINKQVDRLGFIADEKVARDANIGIWPFVMGTGTIRCVSYPTAAEVWLDGVYTGKKTISNVAYLENITVGVHKIEFKKIIDNVPNSCSKSVTVVKDSTVSATCTLVSGIETPTPTPTPSPTPTPTPKPDLATWYIGYAKDANGTVLNVAKVHVDTVYIGHYAPEMLRFCHGCRCDNLVDCGFGSHTVTIKKAGYKDWVKTRLLNAGDEFTDNPVLQLLDEDVFPVVISSVPSGTAIFIDGNRV